MLKQIIFLSLMIAVLPSFTHAKFPSKEFLKRGFQHCKGHCDKGHINCKRGVDKQGYYKWCKAKCLHSNKTDLQKFKDAIAHCDRIHAGGQPPVVSPPPKSPPIVIPTATPRVDLGFDTSKADGDNAGNAVVVIGQIAQDMRVKENNITIPTWEDMRARLMQKPKSIVNFNEATAKEAYEEMFE